MTSKKQTPHRDWLGFVQTSRARSKIRRWLKSLEEAEEEKQTEEKEARPPVRKEPEAKLPVYSRQDVPVGVAGIGNMLLRFAKCCNPLPGDKILGYITRSRGLSVHREGCPNVPKDESARIMNISWDGKARSTYPAGVRVKAIDRPNLLADILTSIRELNVNILSANAYSRKDGTAICDFTIDVSDQNQLNKIIYSIRQVEGVDNAKRSSLTSTS
jgi:guanosine-3',5'-bis(diphosphate) 3'-pyrophosphohydrolase